MAEAITAMTASDRIAAAADETTTTMIHGARRLWLASLGVVGVAADQMRAAFETLEHRGEELEPSVTAPLKRAGETANTLVGRAGASVKNIETGVGRWFKSADVHEEIGKIVEEKLSSALKAIDVATREDLQALADRIEELASKGKRSRESHAD